jgi:hypothetical protein
MSDYSFDPDDLSFLDDLTDVDSFIKSLVPDYHGMAFTCGGESYAVDLNNMHDVSVFISAYIDDHNKMLETIVPKEGVFYHFYIYNHNTKGPLNHHLQHFVVSLGLEGVPLRCSKAFCVAMKRTEVGHVLSDIPVELRVHQLSVVSMSSAAETSYQMALGCKTCIDRKTKCNRMFPCGACLPTECEPREDLVKCMATKAFGDWVSGAFHHSDVLRSVIYHQSIELGGKTGLTSMDVGFLMARLESNNIIPVAIPPRTLTDLPLQLRPFVIAGDMYRVEWMYAEGYGTKTSVAWEANLQPVAKTVEIAEKTKLPYTFCDMIGMQDYRTNIKMLVDSVEDPLYPVVFRGKIIWMGDGNRCMTATITRTSMVLDYRHIISVVVVKRGLWREL